MVASRLLTLILLCLAMAACAATLPGCDEPAAGGTDASTETVKIGPTTFKLDLALDDEHRFKGLSGRTDIPADGGLLFVFPDRAVAKQAFVMRDCPVPIDIIYLDRSGRIVAMYEMAAETPRTDAEKELSAPAGYPDWAKTNPAYEARLKKYPSKYAAQFVIELKGGTLKTLGLKEGQKIQLDTASLKKRAS